MDAEARRPGPWADDAARQDAPETESFETVSFLPDTVQDFFDNEAAALRKARFRASAQLLMQTDYRQLDDAGRAALFRSCASGITGMEVADPHEMFNKRTASDMAGNLDLLRRFANGEWQLIEDPDMEEWRAKKAEGEEAAAKFAHEKIGGAKDASSLGRGMMFGVEAAAMARAGASWQNMQPALEEMNAATRELSYDKLDEEGKAKWRKERIETYERKMAIGSPVATFLKMTGGLDDNAKAVVQRAWRTGELTRDDLKGYSDRQKRQILGAVSLLRGDQKTGTLLLVPGVDVSENGWKANLYALQQSLMDIPGMIGSAAKDGYDYAMAARLSGSEREEAFRRINEEAAIKAALKQPLVEPESFLGAMGRGVAENVWFLLPSMAGAKGLKMMRAAQGLAPVAKGGKVANFFSDLGVTLTPWRAGKHFKEAAKLYEEAAEGAKVARAAALSKGVKALGEAKVDAATAQMAMRRQMAAMKVYTDRLREAEALAAEARSRVPGAVAKWWGGAAVREASSASMFASFFREYVDAADAAGVSREDSVPMGLSVGFVNDLVERIYVPGMEGNLAAHEIKYHMIDSAAQAWLKAGRKGFAEWAKKTAARFAGRTVETTFEESGIEEPIQQMMTEFGLAVNRRQKELRKEGRGDLADALADIWEKASLEGMSEKAFKTYCSAAWESLPGSLGLGMLDIPLSSARQRVSNLWHGRDEGLADAIQRGIDARLTTEKYWKSRGETDTNNPHRFEEAITAARRAFRDPQTSDVVGEVAKAAGLDAKTAEVLTQYLRVEEDMSLVSPKFSAFSSLDMSLADIDEATIKTVLPGYVEGSFASDPENGIYSGRVRMDDGTEKTIAYRVGDIAPFALEIAERESAIDSDLGKSFDERMREAGRTERWATIGEAARYDAALRSVNGFSSGKRGVFELTDAKGEKVLVNADDIIFLANGRLADIGYGAAATQGTVRHETFHSLWRFVRATLKDEDVQQLAKTLGIDVTKDRWEVTLDERMAHEMERYASGHYVSHAVSSRFDKLMNGWAGKIIGFFGKFGPSDEVTDPKTGKPYQLKGLYDSILRGELGSGTLGVELRKVPAQPATAASSASTSSMPVEVTDADRAAQEAEMRGEPGKGTPDTSSVPDENPNLRAEVAAALNTDASSGEVMRRRGIVEFSGVPSLLAGLGVPSGAKIISRVDILRKISTEHHMDAEDIAELPRRYAAPVAVFRDGENFIILTDLMAEANDGKIKPVMVYLEAANEDGKRNFIASAYSRDADKESAYVQWSNAGRLLFLDGKKAASCGLEEGTVSQLRPQAQSGLSSHSVAQSASEVKATAENPAVWNVPNQRHYVIQLPNSDSRIVGRLEVRDVDSGVFTSWDEGYHDRNLQNRVVGDDEASEQDQEDSDAKLTEISAHPDPLLMAAPVATANDGVPWALPNGDMFIGNHRVQGLRIGYAKGTAGEYERYVREDAAKRGIEIGADVKKPLMVFVLERIESPDGKLDIYDVVQLANKGNNREFGKAGTAKNDAKVLIKYHLLSRMKFRADGHIDETKSGDAIGKFRTETGVQEFLNDDGTLTESGEQRIIDAAMFVLLGSTGKGSVLRKISSNPKKLDMQSELRALMKMTPELMSLGVEKPAYDLRAPLAEALQLFTEWRDKDETLRSAKDRTRHDWREKSKNGTRKRGLSWEAFMSQGDMFRTPSDEAKILGDLFARAESLRSFDREDVESEAGKKRVIDLISGYLTDYIKNARAVNTETGDMFGGTPATRAEVMVAQRQAGGENGARFSVDADWGDETRTVPVVNRDTPPWTFVKGKKTKEAKAEIAALAVENLKAQPNYVEMPNENTPALRIDGVIFKVPTHNLFHGADRRLRQNGPAAAVIGDVLNASVEVPGVNAPWHYRIAEINLGTPAFVLITAKESGNTEEIVEMQTLYSVNVKASGAARELNHTDTTRLDADSLANLRAAWQGLFEENLEKHLAGAAVQGDMREGPLFVRDINGIHSVTRMSDVLKDGGKDDIRRFLRENRDGYVRMYHGTGADIPDAVLRRTTAKTARTSQSTRGYVYLSANPEIARRFGQMGYNGPVRVIAVDVKVKELLPDGDSLFLARRDGIAPDAGNTLADSLFYTGNARVKRDILPYEQQQTRYSIAARLDEERKELEAKGGRLVLAHHGTDSAGFTVFEKSDAKGYFFAKSRTTAGSYIRKGHRSDVNKKALPDYQQLLKEKEDEGWIEHGFAIETANGHLLGEINFEHGYTYNSWDRLFSNKEDAETAKLPGQKVVPAKSYNDTLYHEEARIPYKDLLNDGEQRSGVYDVALRMEDPYVIDGRGANWDHIIDWDSAESRDDTTVYDKIAVEPEDGHIYLALRESGQSESSYESFATLEDAAKWAETNLGEDIADRIRRAAEQDSFFEDAGRTLDIVDEQYPYAFDSSNNEGWFLPVMNTREVVDMAFDMGCDGVIFRNIVDNGGGVVDSDEDEVYVVKESKQVKIVDEMTYADDGSIIPAEDRLNWSNDDIRYSIGGIYTGSAADYEKPSLHYVGTGEGSQVYGWGLYGSTVRGVAEGYARAIDRGHADVLFNGKLTLPDTEERAAANLIANRGGLESARKAVDGLVEKGGKLSGYWKRMQEVLSRDGWDDSRIQHEHVYEQTFFTDRAPGDESHLLKWYEPVSETLQNRLLEAAVEEGNAQKSGKYFFFGANNMFEMGTKQTGEELYLMFRDMLGSPKSASEWLAAHGIDGVKYPVDSYGGKTVKDGDEAGWNYVSFRDDNIRVDHKWTDGQIRYSITVTPQMRKDTTVDTSGMTRDKADAALRALAGRDLKNDETSIVAQVNSVQRRKILSNAAVRKSQVNGFSVNEHDAAASILETLWRVATLGESNPDRNGDPSLTSVKRFVAPVRLGARDAYAYITAKESVEHGHRIYSIELEKLEALAGMFKERTPRAANASGVPEGTKQSVSQNGVPAQGGNDSARYSVTAQTETPQFKNFFGDWEKDPENASKVVDKDGRPLVVWHGTDDVFTEFKPEEMRSREGSFFFAENREDAESYSGSGRVMPVYVNLRNPFDYEHGEVPEPYRERWRNTKDKREQVAILKELGYDGWLADFDNGEGWGEISVFEPTQIKSATDNTGAFNPSNPDIRYSLAPNPNLREDIAAALRKNTGGDDTTVQMKRHDEIVFSDNLPFFEFLGLPNTRVVSDVVKVRKFNIKHHLSEDQIAELPYRYNAPVAVMRDGSSGYVLLTDMMGMTDNGETKPVRIFLRPRMWKSGEVVFVATAMAENAKDEKAYYEPIIKHGLLYADENKVAGLALEEETESILRTQASGDDVLTSSDYSWWSTRVSIAQSSADRNGLSTPAQLAAAVAKGSAKRKEEQQESQGESRYSTEAPRSALVYPQLRGMSDEELLSAAVAARIALGKSDKVSDRSVKVTTVQKMMRRLHPEWDTTKIGVESQRVMSGAQKLARRIRDDIGRGVSDSLVLEHLPDTMREQFGREMRQEAREGARLGAFGARANTALEERQAQIVEDAVRVQTGLDSGAIENVYGINLSETIMHLAENPLTEKDATQSTTGEGEGSADEEGSATAGESEEPTVEIDAKVKAVVDDIVSASGRQTGVDEQNRKNRKAAAGRDAENEAAMDEGEEALEAEGDSSGEGTEGDALAEAVKKSALNLENPRHLARFVAELARRQWIKEHSLAKDADVWRDLVAVQFLRKTAQSVYAKLCRDLTYSRSRETAMRGIAKLDSVPTVQGLISEMEFLGALINAQRIRDTQKQMCEKLDLFLRENFSAQGRFKPDKEEGKRKVSAEAELRARYMRHAMWLTPDAAAEEARQLQETLDALSVDFKDAGRDRDQSREFVETIRKLNVLREFGALRYKPVGEIEAAVQWWQDFARGESDDIVREMSDRDIRTKKAAHLLAVAFADPKRKFAREHNADRLNRYITAHNGFILLLRDCMRYASDADRAEVKDFMDWLAREIQKAGTSASAEIQRHSDAFRSAVESIYGKKFDAVMKEMTTVDERFTKFMSLSEGVRDTPTKGRAMQLLVSLLQEGRKVEVEDEENPGKTKFVWEGGYHDNIVKHKREGQAAEIMRLLTPQDMNMLKWLGQWYENNRSDLSDVCHSLFGIGVYAELPNYFPVKMQLEKQGLEKGDGVGWTIFPKALTPRVRNERDFDTTMDIFSMWAGRMEEAAQWKHHAQLGLELRGIFGRSELRETVRRHHGAAVDDLMQGFITDIMAGHGAYDRSTAGVEYYADKIRCWTALCALGGNIGVMFKQVTSIPAFGFEIGLVNTAKYMVSWATPDGIRAMLRLWDSDHRRVRWQSGSSETVKNALASPIVPARTVRDIGGILRRAADGSLAAAGLLKKMLQASMITNKLGDVTPALVIGQGIYRDCLARGMSEEDAMAETWSIVERTQQSSRMENQTQVQRRNKLGRTFYQFLSTQQQYLQNETKAIREVIARPDSVKRWRSLGRAVFLAHFVLPTLYFWAGELYKSCLGQEPPEDEWKDWAVSCLVGPFCSLFVLGIFGKATIERIIKGRKFAGGAATLPMESWVNTQINDGAKLLEAIFDSEGDTWDEASESIGRWMSDVNSTVRDLRKIYRYRVKNEPQKRK